MSNGVIDSPMPNIATSREKLFARIPVDLGQTSFFEGREFRIVRKIQAPIIFKFTSAVDFILSFQKINIAVGSLEFFAWRSDNVTDNGGWVDTVPVLRKNISAEQLSPKYNSQVSVASGGSITVTDSDLYADYDVLSSAGGAGHSSSISDQSTQGRYLAAGTYYLQFTDTGTGAYYLEWEERP